MVPSRVQEKKQNKKVDMAADQSQREVTATAAFESAQRQVRWSSAFGVNGLKLGKYCKYCILEYRYSASHSV